MTSRRACYVAAMLKKEPVLAHALAAVVVGAAALHVPGLDELAAVLLAGATAALARRRVSPS